MVKVGIGDLSPVSKILTGWHASATISDTVRVVSFLFVSANERPSVAAADGIQRLRLHFGARARHAPHRRHRPVLRLRLTGGRGRVLFAQAGQAGLQIPVRKITFTTRIV